MNASVALSTELTVSSAASVLSGGQELLVCLRTQSDLLLASVHNYCSSSR